MLAWSFFIGGQVAFLHAFEATAFLSKLLFELMWISVRMTAVAVTAMTAVAAVT